MSTPRETPPAGRPSTAPYLYETVEGKTDSSFRRLAADGSETLGTFVEGEFVEAS